LLSPRRTSTRFLAARLPRNLLSVVKAASQILFEALPASQRRRYFAWIESAKREETKLRRLKEAIRLLTRGEVLGLT
jgi:uncharacterized protein YdeI (YjbR/CyaY-like superfamily)